METIRVSPVRSIYQSEGYGVAEYRMADRSRITATGASLPLSCDANLTGEFVIHKVYGRQFKVACYEEILPDNPDEMIDYLIFLKIRHLGRVTASRIVAQYGKQTYEAMEDETKLAAVKGISKKTAKEIAGAYLGKQDLQKYYGILTSLGLPSSYVTRVYQRFHDVGNAWEQLRDRPYLLCCCKGITLNMIDGAMKKADQFDPYQADRIRSGVMEGMSQNEQMGHNYAGKDDLVNLAMKGLMDRTAEHTRMKGCIMWTINQLCQENVLIYEYGVLYRRKLYVAEKYIAEKLVAMKMAPVKHRRTAGEISAAVQKAEISCGIKLSEAQRNGVMKALRQNICIITGGPGRGKTTLLKVLLKSERNLRPANRIVLGAPTGRAARRMTENAGEEASTLHHLLEIFDEEEETGDLQIAADVVIVDETSMVSTRLMYLLANAISDDCRLILIGDKNQLPSVKAGKVFADLIASGIFTTVTLDKNFRQAEGSSIPMNGDRINGNHMPLLLDQSTQLICSYGEKDSLSFLTGAVKDLVENRGIPDRDIQILTPFRKRTELGANRLNIHLQAVFNPPAPEKLELKSGTEIFREGDRVIHLKNEEDVSNGDMGYITAIDTAGKKILVTFETGVKKEYERIDLKHLEHAYALTIHKAQGSEYPYVLLPFVGLFGQMRNRPLLYTALTRARKCIKIIGNEQSLAYAAGNAGETRNSFLAYRIASLAQADDSCVQLGLDLESQAGQVKVQGREKSGNQQIQSYVK